MFLPGHQQVAKQVRDLSSKPADADYRSVLLDFEHSQRRATGNKKMLEQEKATEWPRASPGVDSGIWSEVWEGPIGRASPVGGVVTILETGGAFVEIGETYEVGSQVGLRFVRPGTRDEIECECIVRQFVPGEGIGVEFTRIGPARSR